MRADCSVVIPAFNEEGNILKTLKAILRQTVKPNEVIVVNNGSTDLTEQVVKSQSDNFKKAGISLKIINENKKGVARARNRGFFAAKNPIIISTDADSIPRPEWTERLVAYFENEKIAAVTGITVMADAPLPVKIVTEWGWYELVTKLMKMIYGWQTVTTANCAIRKEAFVQAGGFDDDCVEADSLDDTELSSRLAKVGVILIDRRIKVDTSFRRYRQPVRAIRSTWERLKRWNEIAEKRQKTAGQKLK